MMVPWVWVFSVMAAAVTHALNAITADVATALFMVGVHYTPVDKVTLPASVVRVVWLCIPIEWWWLRYWVLWLLFILTNARKGEIAYDIFMFSLWIPAMAGLYCASFMLGIWFVPLAWALFQAFYWCSARKTPHSISLMQQLTSFAVYAYAMGQVNLFDTMLASVMSVGIQYGIWRVREERIHCQHWSVPIGIACLFTVFAKDVLVLAKWSIVFTTNDLLFWTIVGYENDLPQDWQTSLFSSTLMYIAGAQLIRLYR